MAQPFAFPPPPPPPPRKESLPPLDPPQLGYSTKYNNHAAGRGDNFSRGRGRGEPPGFRGYRGRGRGAPGQLRTDQGNRGFNPGLHRHNEMQNSSSKSARPAQNLQANFSSAPGHTPKRPFSTAFDSPAMKLPPRPAAAPAVPSFGGDLLPPPSSPTPSTASSSKKPRKHNQLGLTPTYQDQESGSGEDEEAQLAQSASAMAESKSDKLLQFEFRGRTAVLRTAADIAAWIAERKRNFPTLAKFEAAKKETEERKKKEMESRREKVEAQKKQKQEGEKARQEELRQKALESVVARKGGQLKRKETGHPGNEEASSDGTAAGAVSKMEKLKNRLERAQQEAQRAEEALAKLQQARHATREAQSSGGVEEVESHAPHVKPTATSCAKADNLASLKKELLKDDGTGVSDASDSSSIMLLSGLDSDTDDDEEDNTSSSGSSTTSRTSHPAAPRSDSGSDSAASSNSSAPPTQTSKRTRPDRVAPPRRQSQPQAAASNESTPCRNMLRLGHCRFRDRCRYSHEIPEHLVPASRKKKPEIQKGKDKNNGSKGAKNRDQGRKRKSLYQVMVEKEQEEERRLVLQGIIELGKAGVLDQDDHDHGRKGGIRVEVRRRDEDEGEKARQDIDGVSQ